MPKVYGSVTYDFRRHHRLAECPVEPGQGLEVETLPEKQLRGNISSSITLLDIQRDRVTKIAAANWLKTAGVDASARKLDPEPVREIYETSFWFPEAGRRSPLQRFMILEIEAIISDIWPGLTMVIVPPGTGKMGKAVQILNVLYHNCLPQRTLIVSHSNQVLNDLFEKIMQRPDKLALN